MTIRRTCFEVLLKTLMGWNKPSTVLYQFLGLDRQFGKRFPCLRSEGLRIKLMTLALLAINYKSQPYQEENYKIQKQFTLDFGMNDELSPLELPSYDWWRLFEESLYLSLKNYHGKMVSVSLFVSLLNRWRILMLCAHGHTELSCWDLEQLRFCFRSPALVIGKSGDLKSACTVHNMANPYMDDAELI